MSFIFRCSNKCNFLKIINPCGEPMDADGITCSGTFSGSDFDCASICNGMLAIDW